LRIEPQAGIFNPDAFKLIDYAIKAVHDRGIGLIITLNRGILAGTVRPGCSPSPIDQAIAVLQLV
jgi:hypothetical protein